MTSIVYVMVGLPASGKSSIVKEKYSGIEVVSRDLLNGNKSEARKKLENLLKEGKSVVVDNTNYDRATRAEIISLAKKYNYSIESVYVKIDKQTALKRNKQREGKKRVPDVAIHTLARKFQEPTYDEGFSNLIVIEN